MRKVRVKKSPGQSPGFNSDKFPVYYPGSEWTKPDTEVRSSIPHAEDGMESMEAEGGESIFIPDVGGLPAHYDVVGPRHGSGGVKLDVPENSFVFSDTRDMKIGGPILKHFGKSEDTKKKFTPADLAKKYDINKFRKTLADPDSDLYQVKTAEMMIANYNKKLGMLGLVQESKKGFPEGIPQVAMPYLITAAVEPDQVLPLKGTPGQEMMQPGASNEAGMMKFGGNWFDGNGYQDGGYVQPRAVHPGEQWWENKTVGPGSASETGSKKFWNPFDENEGFIDWAGNALEYGPKRMNQAIRGYYEWPSETMDRFKPGHPVLGFVNDFIQDPVNAVPIADVAKLAGKGTILAGKTLAKIPGIKRAVQYMAAQPWEFYGDMVKAYGHDAAKKIGKLLKNKSVGYVPSVLSQIQRHTQATQSDQSQYPPLPPGGYNPNPENFVQRRDTTQVTTPFPVDTVIPKMSESQLDSTDWANFAYGGQYQSGGKSHGKIVKTEIHGKEKWIKYADGFKERIPVTKAAAKSSGKAAPVGEIDPYDPVAQYLDLGDDQTMYGYGVAKKQASNPKGGYGKQDFESFKTNNKEILERFKREHNGREYTKSSKPNADTKWYQEAHWEQTYQDGLKAGYPPELARNMANGLSFTGDDDNSVRSIDSKHGDWTNSRVRFKFKPYQKAVQESSTNKGWNIPSPDYNKAATDAPWWLQDVIKTAGAAGDFLRLKKYLPWAPKLAPYVSDPVFFDPTRELAANSEQMAIGTQGSAIFAGPQQFSSRFSGIQGQGAKNAADILGKYNNMNVQTANVAGAQKADIYNKANEFNAKTALDLYDKTTLANQNYDNSKNMARQELRQSYVDAITNRAQAQTLNSMYENYQFDPSSGGLTNFYHGDRMLPGSSGSSVLSTLKEYENAGYTRDQAIDILNSQNKDEYNDARLNLARQSGYGSRRRQPSYPQVSND